MGHEATVSKVSDDQLFYLMSRGLTEDEAMAMVVRGFVEPIAKGTADGIRPRTQSTHRTADGRSRRLMADPRFRAPRRRHHCRPGQQRDNSSPRST